MRYFWRDREELGFYSGLRVIPGGMSGLVDAIAKESDVRLGQPVQRIAWGGNQVVADTAGTRITAQTAIVTVPLGVLKAGTITFDPPLPEEKQTAMNRLATGDGNRLALSFRRLLWPKEVNFYGYVSPNPGRFLDWTNVAALRDAPAMKLWSVAGAARELAEMDDDAVVAQGLGAMSKVWPRTAQALEEYAFVRWSTDPSSRGAWPIFPLGSTDADCEALAKPVAGRLFFAGDATDVSGFGTMRGAIASGRRAAKELTHRTAGVSPR